MAVHQIWWERMVPEDIKADLEPVYVAHQAEHLAEAYKIQVMEQLGIDPAALDDPAVQDMLAQQAAMVTQLMAPPTIGLQEATPTDASDGVAEFAEVERKDQAAQADIDRKDALALAQIDRDDAKAQAEIERAAERDFLDAAREAARTEAELDAIEKGGD